MHGMRGCGKSTLVVDVLRHSYTLALETFKVKIVLLQNYFSISFN